MPESTLFFVIVAFGLAALMIYKKDSIPPTLRRGMAIITLVFVCFAFFLVVYSFFTMGKPS